MSRKTSPILPYQEFLAAVPGRRGDALEIGHDFTDEHDNRYRVAWYAHTGELTFERITDPDTLDLEDFHHGIATAQVIAQLDRAELEDRLGAWPQVEHCQPRTLARVRELLTTQST